MKYRIEREGRIPLDHLVEELGGLPKDPAGGYIHTIELPGGYLEIETTDNGGSIQNGEGDYLETDRAEMAGFLQAFRTLGLPIRRIVAVLVLVMAALIATPNMAEAQGCPVQSFWQRDMAGSYVSVHHDMKVDVFNCGLVVVTWRNDYGWHTADYRGAERVMEGGIIATLEPGYRGLDSGTVVGIKPAEPGYVQVLTPNGKGGVWVYRLEKVANVPLL